MGDKKKKIKKKIKIKGKDKKKTTEPTEPVVDPEALEESDDLNEGVQNYTSFGGCTFGC